MSAGTGLGKAQFAVLRLGAIQLMNNVSAPPSAAGAAGGQILLNAGLRELVPWGWKGTGRKIVSGMERSAKITARQQMQQRVDALVNQARALAASYSVNDSSLRAAPNSAKLLRRFGQALDRGPPASRLRALVGAIDVVSALDLIPNQEVPLILERRRFERVQVQTEKSAPELAELIRRSGSPQDPNYYEARISPFRVSPKVAEPLDGAIARLREGGPDAFRQGAGSLRVALEALLAELTGEREWQSAVGRLVTSKEERGIVQRLHRLLSRSAHAGHVTSKADLQLGLDLFAAVGARLVQLRGERFGSEPRPS
jgi:hypothetical protein